MPLKSLAVFLFLSFCVQVVTAQNEEKLDTIYNPKVVYSAIPQKYEIAGITVTGAPYYEDYVLIGYSGLEVGQVIEIPGNAITEAAKKFWRQGLFSDVVITQALLSAVPITDYYEEQKRERIILQGEVPSPMNMPEGCPFHPRCAYATGQCRKEVPRLREAGKGHL